MKQQNKTDEPARTVEELRTEFFDTAQDARESAGLHLPCAKSDDVAAGKAYERYRSAARQQAPSPKKA
jgi:hypothetical protein